MTTAVNLTDRIRSQIKDLPPLPKVVNRLVKVVGDDRSNAEDVTKVLAGDQALTAKVLKLVNSSFYGQSGEIATITRAVVVLGFAAVRNLALGLAAGGALKRAGGAEYQRRFWTHALATACAAEALAGRGNGGVDPEEAFVAGLLHDIGHPVLALAAPAEFAEVFAGGPDALVAREEAVFGLGHAKAGQMLLRQWKLPEHLGEVARFHHHGKICAKGDAPLVTAVCLADLLASVLDTGFERTADDPDLATLAGIAGLNLADLPALLADAAARMEERRGFLEIATDGEVGAAPLPPWAPPRVAVLGGDPARLRWLLGVLEFYRCPQVAMKGFLTGEPVDVVLVDRPGVSDDQLAKLVPVLRSAPVVAVVGDAGGSVAAVLGRPTKNLPLAFSRNELA